MPRFLERAVSLGFDAVVTGHYARVITNDDGNRELHRAADWAKDQSYVLGVLTHEQLKHAWFPLATTPSKAEVRAEAERRGFRLPRNRTLTIFALFPRAIPVPG